MSDGEKVRPEFLGSIGRGLAGDGAPRLAGRSRLPLKADINPTCWHFLQVPCTYRHPGRGQGERLEVPTIPLYNTPRFSFGAAMGQERSDRVERRLLAILAADVAGYSRLMHNDEEATHARLTALLADAVEPSIAEHAGRTVKNTGDGFLAEFPSAVEAVRSAMQFQTRIKELTMGELEDRRIAFRVGVNIGDVIVEAHDIFGDGVNIAARLEAASEPGGIWISSSAYDQVRGKVGVEFADLGKQNLKNIARPVRAYAVAGNELGSRRNADAAIERGPPALSIVVLPFTNI